MNAKEYITWGLVLWLGGGIVGGIFRFAGLVSREVGARLFLGIAGFFLGLASFIGFIMLIIGVVKLVTERKNPPRNVRIARRVR